MARKTLPNVTSGDRQRALVGRFLFEIVIIFIGVTAAFAIEALRQRSEEADYRRSMIAALVPTLDDVIAHNNAFEREVSTKLAAFDGAIARGEKPALPVFRETGSERPPTRAWDGIVATGAAKALEPAMFFRLALFYTRQDSFGEKYIRYNDFTEQRVFALGRDQSSVYDSAGGRLKPEYTAWVNQLRDLQILGRHITKDATQIRIELLASN
jgi:hypothetical protein